MRHKCFEGWSWNQSEIRHKNGSSITFVGLSNVSRENLRSFEAVDLVWCEEAHALSAESLRVLLPTIRREGSRLYFTYNPQVAPADPVESIVKPMPSTLHVHTTFKDCEIFLSSVTRAMIEHDRAHNYNLFEHIWEGLPLAFSESRVFKNFSVQEFSYEALRAQWETEEDKEPVPCLDGMFRSDFEKLLKERRRKKTVGLLFGADWGFAADPSAGVRMFYSPDAKRLYIEYEYYQIGVTVDKLPGELIQALPGVEKSAQVRGDASRPELVRHVQQHGVPGMKSCRKWRGSIEDGIQHLQALDEIIVHPRCTNTIDELRVFSHLLDKHTGAILPELEDSNNHLIDSIRYALEDHIKPDGYAYLKVVESV
jgi:phage terminase large subunit